MYSLLVPFTKVSVILKIVVCTICICLDEHTITPVTPTLKRTRSTERRSSSSSVTTPTSLGNFDGLMRNLSDLIMLNETKPLY